MEQYILKSALLAEIERLVNNYDKALDYEAALEDVRNFIDSLEVKKSAETQHVNETCKENGNSLTQQPVSEELETFAKKESEAFAEREYEIGYIDRNALGKGYYWGCIDGAKWKKEQMMAKAVDGVVTFDYYEGDKAYGCVAHDSFCLEDLGLKDRDEVKILILKSNEL